MSRMWADTSFEGLGNRFPARVLCGMRRQEKRIMRESVWFRGNDLPKLGYNTARRGGYCRRTTRNRHISSGINSYK